MQIFKCSKVIFQQIKIYLLYEPSLESNMHSTQHFTEMKEKRKMSGRKLKQHLSVLNDLTLILLLAFKRKLAVCASIGGWLGIGRWPRAIPTMAVMWVSVPKT